jgi:hypothetical protein
MKNILYTATWFSLLFACSPDSGQKVAERKDSSGFVAQQISIENLTPTVDIKGYTLITKGDENRGSDAEQIMALKRKWPLVMQSPNRVGLDTILSQNFTFADAGTLLNRNNYITDRIQRSDWKITDVKYDNLTLQFFGNTALLTYRNQVTNENTKTKEIEVEHISWADMYVLENGIWKIGASHTIDVKIQK